MSPTQRSLAHLRGLGYVAEVVEKWIPGANIRRDLFGFIDIVAIRENEVLGVQSTSGGNVASRVAKISEAEHVGAVRKAGIKIFVHGWRKGANGKWTLREIDCS